MVTLISTLLGTGMNKQFCSFEKKREENNLLTKNVDEFFIMQNLKQVKSARLI